MAAASQVNAPRFVSYLRVSTARQGASGLGLEAQREAVTAHIRMKAGPDAAVLHEYIEQESGKRSDRPQLQAALRHARRSGAVLVIAKLDRLSRNAAFLLTLRDSGAKFVAADMPDACDLTIGVLALVAEHERELIAARTKAALAAKKAVLERQSDAMKSRGEEPVRVLPDGSKRPLRLGNPNGARCLAGLGNGPAVAAVKSKAADFAEGLREVLADVDPAGQMSARSLAEALNVRHIQTPRKGSWTAQSVIRLRDRLQVGM